MHKGLRWSGILGVAVVGVLAPVYLPQALANVEVFRANDVETSGLGYVSRAEVLELAGIVPATSVWEPLEEFERRILEHPMVRSVTVERDLPDRLVIRIVEREPVGFVATPTLEPIDREGRFLPLDPARWTLDLPFLSPRLDPAAEAGRPGPARLRMLASVAGAIRDEGVFWTHASEIRETESGDIVAEWGDPEVTFQLGRSTDVRRLQMGVEALQHALGTWKDRTPVAVDLRWAGQVVVRFKS